MLEAVSKIIWGAPLITVIFALGLYLTVKLKFIQIRKLKDGIRLLLRKPEGSGSISAFASLATSLAAMIGTGNIVGVATAVSIGGAGAIFWMIVAAFFGMSISYMEGYFAIKYREVKKDGKVLGGAFMYIEKGLGSKTLAKIFAAFTILSALLGIGTMTQSNSIAEAFCDLYKFRGNALAVAVVVTLLAGFILKGGIERVSGVSTVVVPVMGLVYVLGTLAVLFVYRSEIPNAVMRILGSALDFKAILGGGGGIAIRMGVSRGIFSNEAGLGSSSIASAAAKTESGENQGLCTMVGTWIDTILLCTMTGLAIVVTGSDKSGLTGVALTNYAYNAALPVLGKLIVSTSLILFSFASIIGWSYYGEQSTEYLFGARKIKLYRVIYLLGVFMGPFLKISVVWTVADILNGLMAIPNLIALFFLSKKFFVKKRGKCKKNAYYNNREV